MAMRSLITRRHLLQASQRTMFRSFAKAAKEDTSEEPVSWFQKLKGIFVGSKPEPSSESTAASNVAASPAESESAEELSFEKFADELKKARRLGAVAKLTKGSKAQEVLSLLMKQEEMLRALGSCGSQHIGAQEKAKVAEKCGTSIPQVEEILSKYEWAKEAQRRVDKLKKEGKPLPKNFAEVQAMMGKPSAGGSGGASPSPGPVGRNQACPCGSGKKYKRCCGLPTAPTF